MPTLVVTYTFASSAQGFGSHAGTWSNLTWNGSLGNPPGSLESNYEGSGGLDSNYWAIATTFVALGVPTNATITGITAGSLDSQCIAFTGTPTGCTSGAATLTAGATIATLSSQRSISGLDGTWVTSGGVDATGLSLDSSLLFTIFIPNTLGATVAGANKSVTLVQDNLAFTLTYVTAALPYGVLRPTALYRVPPPRRAGRVLLPRWFTPPPPQVQPLHWAIAAGSGLIGHDARNRRRGRVWVPTVAPAVPVFGPPPVPTGFSQEYILSVNPPYQYGTELLLSWVADAPAGLVFQVYLDGQLVWSGSGTSASIPLPAVAGRIDIGTVSAANQQVSFGSSLPAAPLREAELTWTGGTYEAADIGGFHVYGSDAPGGSVDYGSVLATVPAYTAGIVTDGYGYGGFGQGGFGEAAGSYSWTSGPKAGGSWAFGVKAFDTAGNEGTAATATVAIAAPPLEPGAFGTNLRLKYTYVGPPTFEATLTWNSSPAA